MLIYRIENELRQGPYVGAAGYDATYEAQSQPGSGYPAFYESHPGPARDVLLKDWWNEADDSRAWRFGFNSIEQLKEWFPEENWHIFAKHNDNHTDTVGIATYEVSEDYYKEGLKQAVFHPEHAQLTSFKAFATQECVTAK